MEPLSGAARHCKPCRVYSAPFFFVLAALVLMMCKSVRCSVPSVNLFKHVLFKKDTVFKGNKKLVVTSATLVVTKCLTSSNKKLVVTFFSQFL